MAMWKYLKHFDERYSKIFFFEILSLPYFRKFSHSKISTYTVSKPFGLKGSDLDTYTSDLDLKYSKVLKKRLTLSNNAVTNIFQLYKMH